MERGVGGVVGGGAEGEAVERGEEAADEDGKQHGGGEHYWKQVHPLQGKAVFFVLVMTDEIVFHNSRNSDS